MVTEQLQKFVEVAEMLPDTENAFMSAEAEGLVREAEKNEVAMVTNVYHLATRLSVLLMFYLMLDLQVSSHV